ncbi:MAG: VOC family protein [Planctomycetota bacterium]|nr:MAG: VOC family protein [Planctomycetota bacterium]
MTDAIKPLGSFGWNELGTQDLAAARKFYDALLNWNIRSSPMEGGGDYPHISVDGHDIGGMYQITEEMGGANVPSHWLGYVAVSDADAIVARAKELGGSLMMGPMDIPNTGRIAVLKDPQGAAFALFQSSMGGDKATRDLQGAPGNFCWFELATKDAKAAAAFYSELLGWTAEAMEGGPFPYTLFKLGDYQVGGMLEMNEQWGEVPPHWMSYISVPDCDQSAAKVKELGGQVCVPPTDIPTVGRFSVINDPTGGTISLITLAEA